MLMASKQQVSPCLCYTLAHGLASTGAGSHTQQLSMVLASKLMLGEPTLLNTELPLLYPLHITSEMQFAFTTILRVTECWAPAVPPRRMNGLGNCLNSLQAFILASSCPLNVSWKGSFLFILTSWDSRLLVEPTTSSSVAITL